eukprot:jgi/Astpho2/2141/Aster-03135
MGAYLSTPNTAKETWSGSMGSHGPLKLVFGGASMQGWRRSMEDAHIAQTNLGDTEDAAIFGVFDGHGGSEVARFCQRYMAGELMQTEAFSRGRVEDSLVEVFHKIDLMLKDETYLREIENLSSNQPDEGEQNMNSGEALDVLKAILEIKRGPARSPPENQHMLEDSAQASQRPQYRGGLPGADKLPDHKLQAGCTAVVAVLRGRDLYVANAGDSRAVLCRGGRAVALSEDHKPASEVERSRIMAAGGFLSDIGGVTRVNGNLNLSRAIGDLKYKGNRGLPAAEQIITAQPDVQHVTLVEADQFFLLGCDGVWDVLSNQEACDFVLERLRPGASLNQIACELLDRCLASNPHDTRGIGCDNMTFTIVVLGPGVS